MAHQLITWYLSVGCAIYVVFCLKDLAQGLPRFRKATVMDILRGASIPFVWPFILWLMEINMFQRYKFKFNACKRGAIGVSQDWEREVVSDSQSAAMLKLYDEFDHIRMISTEVESL